MHTHTLTPVKFLPSSQKEKYSIFWMSRHPAVWETGGEGVPVPGTSANPGNSLEPEPLESNWHFEINLCQEPSEREHPAAKPSTFCSRN